MSSLDDLEDETPISTGAEIGQALSVAVGELNKSNEAMVSTLSVALAKAMTDALKAVDSKQITVNEKQGISKWCFKVERDKQGLMTQVTATATKEK